MSEETRLDVYRGNGLMRLQSVYDSFSERTKNQLSTGFFGSDAMVEIQSTLESQGESISDSRNIDSLVEIAKQDLSLRRKDIVYSNPKLQKYSQQLDNYRERIKQNLYELEEELSVGTDLKAKLYLSASSWYNVGIVKKPHLSVMVDAPIIFRANFKEKKGELKLFGNVGDFWRRTTSFDAAFDEIKKQYFLGLSKKIKGFGSGFLDNYNQVLSFYLNIKKHVTESQEARKKELEAPLKSLQELIMEENNPIRE